VERLKVDVKKLLGLLIGVTILGEGSFLIWYARSALIGGIGHILTRTVSLFGIVIAVLGLLMVLSWALKDLKFLRAKPRIYQVLSILATVMFIGVMAIGLGLTMNARSVAFDGGYDLGPVAVAVLCAQFFIFGALSAALWFKRDSKVKNLVAFLGGNLGSIGIAASGAMIYGCAAPLTATYLLDIGAGKMHLVGLMLIVLGFVGVVAWALAGSRVAKGKVLLALNIIVIATSALTVIGAIYLSGVASKFILGNFFSGTKVQMVAFASVLFLMAATAASAWMVREKTLNRRFLLQALGMLAGLVLATAGVAVLGFAGETKIEGLGTLPHNLIFMFGGQIILLGGMSTLSWVLKDTKYFNFGFRKTALDLMMIMLMSIAVVDGLAALMVAADTNIVEIGLIRQRTMFIFGAGLAGLGLLSLITWTFRENPAPPRLKRIEFLIFLFWTLMVVAGIVL